MAFPFTCGVRTALLLEARDENAKLTRIERQRDALFDADSGDLLATEGTTWFCRGDGGCGGPGGAMPKADAVPERVIRVADNPVLSELQGCTFITSDGTTLLGADDKSGVAIIMETVACLQRQPQLPELHGAQRL